MDITRHRATTLLRDTGLQGAGSQCQDANSNRDQAAHGNTVKNRRRRIRRTETANQFLTASLC